MFGGVKLFAAPRRKDVEMAMAQTKVYNQMQSMRKPPMEIANLRSSFDLDGIASDAVEGRNKQLDFYRKRNSARFST